MRARGGGPSPRVDGVEAYPDSRSSSMASTRTGVRRLVCYRPLASSRFWIWSQESARLHRSRSYTARRPILDQCLASAAFA